MIKKILISLILCMCMLVGCNSNTNPIKGHWIKDCSGYVHVYFNDDEYNSVKIVKMMGETTGTYEVKGDSLRIITKTEENIYNYKIENDVLELSDPNDPEDVEVYYRANDNDQ